MPLKDKLNNLTGLQRVFLVAFLICWGYFALWGSLVKTEDANKGNADYAWAVSRDFANPACLPYTIKPMSELTQPQWTSDGGNCWHIYTHRFFNEVKLPFTEAAYDRGETIRYWELFFKHLGIYTALALASFGLLMLAYKIGLWVVAGFKKPK